MSEFQEALTKLTQGSTPRRSDSAPELDINQVGRGMHACYRNATGLMTDARILSGSGRAPRAASLAVLAVEELSKIVNLHDRYADALLGDKAWEGFWNGYFYRHGDKLQGGIEYAKKVHEREADDKPWSLNRFPTGFRVFLPEGSKWDLNTVKQRGFYTDFVDGEFVAPPDVTEDFIELLDRLLAFAEERCDAFSDRHVTLKRSLRTAYRTWEMVRRFCEEATGEHGVSEDRMREIHRKCQQLELPDDDRGPSREELAADLRTALVRCSSESIPDYVAFEGRAETLIDEIDGRSLRGVLAPLCTDLQMRLDQPELLPESARRAYRMGKLLLKWLVDRRSWDVTEAQDFVFGQPDAKPGTENK